MTSRKFRPAISRITASLLLAAGLASAGFIVPQAAQAEAPNFVLSGNTWIKDNLAKAVNTRITLRLIAGEEITGTVVAVGDDAVHLTSITGRDFYDAVISLEMISAVIVNVRGQAK